MNGRENIMFVTIMKNMDLIFSFSLEKFTITNIIGITVASNKMKNIIVLLLVNTVIDIKPMKA